MNAPQPRESPAFRRGEEVNEYGDVADGDWSATVAQGREMLADIDRHVAWLVASRDTEVSRSDI